MTHNHQEPGSKAIVLRTIRAISSVSAACGLVINTIVFLISLTSSDNYVGHAVDDLTGFGYIPLVCSIAWNHLEPRVKRATPVKFHFVTMIVDTGLFLGFLALLVANGIIGHDLEADYDATMLLAYNSMPWVLCAIIHLCFILSTLKDAVGLQINLNLRPLCRDCQSKMPRILSMSKDGAQYGLLGDLGEEDVEDLADARASSSKKGPIHLEGGA